MPRRTPNFILIQNEVSKGLFRIKNQIRFIKISHFSEQMKVKLRMVYFFQRLYQEGSF